MARAEGRRQLRLDADESRLAIEGLMIRLAMRLGLVAATLLMLGGSGQGPQHLCPCCGALLETPFAGCNGCGTRFVTTRRAGWLALALPGGGHLATDHRRIGGARALTELWALSWFWNKLPVAESYAAVAGIMLPVSLLLLVLKLDAMVTARALARLLTPTVAVRERWWAIAGWLGVVMLLLFALVVAGRCRQAETTVNRDLEMHNADWIGWQAQYQPAGSALRSTWHHDDGWLIEVEADSLPPFQEPDDYRATLDRTLAEEGLAPALPFALGAVHGLKVVRRGGSGAEAWVELEYVVIDHAERDLHHVRGEAFATQIDELDAVLQTLLRRAHWTRLGDPCGSQWDAGPAPD